MKKKWNLFFNDKGESFNLNYSQGLEVVFQCRDEGPIRARVRWTRPGGRPLPPGSRDVNGRLEIPNIRVSSCRTTTVWSVIIQSIIQLFFSWIIRENIFVRPLATHHRHLDHRQLSI